MLAATTILNYIRRSSLNLFSWMEWILKNNLPLSFCENEAAWRYSNLDPICVETLVSGMGSLARSVERVIAAEMPDRFGLIFDGMTHASEHYIAVYARYEVDGVAKTPLLCMAPLLSDEEEDLPARGHMEFLATMLPRGYGKQLGMCCFLVADNCSVNRRLATLMGVPLVVQLELADYEEELDTVQKLMLKLRTLTQLAKLRYSKTQLRPVIRQDTRWRSTFSMIKHYFDLLEFIDAIDDELEDLMPSPAQNRCLRALLKDLAKVDSVANALQGTDVSILDARIWLDGLIAIKPPYSRRLRPRAEIVHSPNFEAGCVRVLSGDSSRLTRAVKVVLVPFIATDPRSNGEDDAEGREEATSNVAERFFSVAKTTFGRERHGLPPITIVSSRAERRRSWQPEHSLLVPNSSMGKTRKHGSMFCFGDADQGVEGAIAMWGYRAVVDALKSRSICLSN
ncbi:hypothetical protein F443_17017 [Phytophthora nicotianae P1569]|uniref:HAT C-terminal dimerisation domain-containing protein n=1 Tax=Phytophthora nicotianae P1569 TaxID=1317065 RepID=V9EFT5_PHYNI|nr:hypothetical protein F443_17017 [Phytophthora nicotianae P1569]